MALIKVENNIALLDHEVVSSIAYFEKTMKYCKKQEELLKTAILKEMEQNGIVKLDTPEMSITYVNPTDKEYFNSKSFRADYPDIYDEYVELRSVKPSIRIKVKNNE